MQFIKKAKAATKSALVRGAALAITVASPLVAHADTGTGTGTSTAVDFTQLTSGINWSSVITAVLAVSLSMVGVYVAIKGSKIVLRMVRGA